MSVVIIGGHDRMVCQYKDVCKNFGCKAKVYTQMVGDLENKIGDPDLMILLTNPVSHKMAKIAKRKAVKADIPLVQSHQGSKNAIQTILAEQTGR
jgi:hypothetical protein